MKLKTRNFFLVLTGVLFAPFASAADLLVPSGGIDVGSGKLRPKFALRGTYNDNLTFAPKNELDTFGTLIDTGLNYELKGSKNRVFTDYSLSVGLYDEGRDDYANNKIRLGYEYTPTSRIRVGVSGEYFDTQDARGTFASEGQTVDRDPDEWHHYKLGANLAYGASGAKGQFKIKFGYTDKTYENNRDQTRYRDRETTFINSKFLYRVMPKTSLVLEGQATDLSYDHTNLLATRGSLDSVNVKGLGSLDSVNVKGLVGVAWSATAKTTGEAKIGYIKKMFDSSGRADSDTFAWEIGAQWRPKSYSVFELTTLRSFYETNGFGNTIVRSELKLNWNHRWTEKIGTNANMNYGQDSFKQSSRSDDILGFGISVNYKLRRWLDIGLAYNYLKRDSEDNDSLSYEQNLTSIFTGISF